jgi:hypothetical protein
MLSIAFAIIAIVFQAVLPTVAPDAIFPVKVKDTDMPGSRTTVPRSNLRSATVEVREFEKGNAPVLHPELTPSHPVMILGVAE